MKGRFHEPTKINKLTTDVYRLIAGSSRLVGTDQWMLASFWRPTKGLILRFVGRRKKYSTMNRPRGDVKIPLLKLVTFCRKTSNVCWWSFVDQLHHLHMLGSKVTCVTTASCCYTILGNAFLLNGGSSHQPSAKG